MCVCVCVCGLGLADFDSFWGGLSGRVSSKVSFDVCMSSGARGGGNMLAYNPQSFVSTTLSFTVCLDTHEIPHYVCFDFLFVSIYVCILPLNICTCKD